MKGLFNIHFLFCQVECSKSIPNCFPLNKKMIIIGLKMTPFYYLNYRGVHEVQMLLNTDLQALFGKSVQRA